MTNDQIPMTNASTAYTIGHWCLVIGACLMLATWLLVLHASNHAVRRFFAGLFWRSGAARRRAAVSGERASRPKCAARANAGGGRALLSFRRRQPDQRAESGAAGGAEGGVCGG